MGHHIHYSYYILVLSRFSLYVESMVRCVIGVRIETYESEYIRIYSKLQHAHHYTVAQQV